MVVVRRSHTTTTRTELFGERKILHLLLADDDRRVAFGQEYMRSATAIGGQGPDVFADRWGWAVIYESVENMIGG